MYSVFFNLLRWLMIEIICTSLIIAFDRFSHYSNSSSHLDWFLYKYNDRQKSASLKCQRKRFIAEFIVHLKISGISFDN